MYLVTKLNYNDENLVMLAASKTENGLVEVESKRVH